MWFKNLQIFRISNVNKLDPAALQEQLAKHAFSQCGAGEMQSQGWAAPRDDERLVHSVNGQLLLLLTTEKKLLPSTIINQVTKAKASELEEQQGFAPGRKAMKDLKERVTEELLPRAFGIKRSTWVWIDTKNGWLIIDSSSPTKADEVIKLLLKSTSQLPLESLRVKLAPQSAMTDWLINGDAPKGFTIDQDTELSATTEDKATIRYVRHSIDQDDVQRHIAAGKQCTKLALTWNDRVSFVLTNTLTLKRIKPLDILDEDTDKRTSSDDERFDADLVLMSAELAGLLDDLVFALGGEVEQGLAA